MYPVQTGGVVQVSFFPIPLLQSAVIEHFYAVLNNKRHDIVFETFLEHDQPLDTSVAVLEGVNALKPHMERKDIFKHHRFLAVILIEQPFHFRRHFLGQGCFPLAFLGDANGVCFKNKVRLLIGQAAALYVIRVVGQSTCTL